MSLLKLTNFGGEVPRVKPRALPDGAAQKYENLLATSADLRPLPGDKTVGTAPAGAKTLYRLSRNADGTLRTGDTAGWIAEAADKNFVKGQLNDDATERTVVTWNDGTQAPRVIDAKGENRLLGVPAPQQLSVTVAVQDEFTTEKATVWIEDELKPALAAAVRASLVAERVSGGVPVAGARSLHGKTPDAERPWILPWPMNQFIANNLGLKAPELGGYSTTTYSDWLLPLLVIPHWGRIVDRAALEGRLRAILNPKDNTQLLPDDKIEALATAIIASFDPAGDSIKAHRDKMEQAALDFTKALTFQATDPGPRPVEPTKPSVPEWYLPFWDGNEERHPQWIAYDAAYKQWQSDLAEWEKKSGQETDEKTGLVARLQSIQADAAAAGNAVEAEYYRRLDRLDADINRLLSSYTLISGEDGDGLIKVAPDRIVDSRFYVMTWVNDWGWESAPSPVSEMVEVDQNDSVAVATVPPPNDRHITHWRLYRSNTGTATSTFQFVDEILASVVSYQDEKKGGQLGEPCPTLTWVEPPDRRDSASPATIKPLKGPDPHMKGAVGMPNGIIAGFVDNFVGFCHPYHPYAWPVEYQITTEFPIVGLGVFGQTLFVGTQGNPYLITGADSASMSAEKLDAEHACISRRSIVSVGNGVVYASPDGLCLAAASRSVELLTGALFSREDWQALNPSSIVAAAHEGVYYFWTDTACWALDFVEKKLGRVTGIPATAVHRDTITDHLYVVSGGSVRKLFAEGRRTATWRSGIAQLPAQAPLAWMQVDSDFTAGPVTVQWIGDGQVRHTHTFNSIEPKRLPPGRWLEHEVEVTTASRVTKVLLAGNTQELKSA